MNATLRALGVPSVAGAVALAVNARPIELGLPSAALLAALGVLFWKAASW